MPNNRASQCTQSVNAHQNETAIAGTDCYDYDSNSILQQLCQTEKKTKTMIFQAVSSRGVSGRITLSTITSAGDEQCVHSHFVEGIKKPQHEVFSPMLRFPPLSVRPQQRAHPHQWASQNCATTRSRIQNKSSCS